MGWRWAIPPTPQFCIEIPTCWYILALPNAKICASPDASQWNIGGVGSSGFGHVYFDVYFMYISCIFHVVCASFSALATRKLADAKAVFSGIWAKELVPPPPLLGGTLSSIASRGLRVKLKGRFHETTNHADEREKTANDKNKLDRRDRF